eukprot:TRINITY_DN16717_c0_g1_i5.p2 TRINITY_DN16717_c0_g1~~TRINITY_DN16717_c0_g1_i5.p2  ORF type:complete len:138 (+),score=24.64 TRINITY_DN16717_c0_g1_i5:185-598(+)
MSLEDSGAWLHVVDSVTESNPLTVVNLEGKPFDMRGLTRPSRIAVLDSSFNPPTRAHDRLLKLTEAAPGVGPIDLRVLMVAKANVDKKIVGAQLPERLAMMQRMAQEPPSPPPAATGRSQQTALAVSSFARFVDKAW